MARWKPLGRRAFAVWLVMAVLAVSAVASATVMLYTDVARLVELSDVIVQGRVVDQHTFFDDDKNEIATITTVELDRVFYGEDIGKTVKFRQWGGEWGDRLARIPGDAQFAPYEECVLFLVDGKDEFAGMRYLTALGQSKFTIVRHAGGAHVIRNLGDLAFLNPDDQSIRPKSDERYEYQAFVAELEALVAGIKGGDR